MQKQIETSAVCRVFVMVAVLVCSSLALAQSSGNFSAAATRASCALNTSTGALTPGCTPVSNGTTCSSLSVPIKTSNASGLTLLVTPSMVTGLFTDTKINSQISSASADVGIQVCLEVDNSTAGILPAGGCVVYDQRFQQISSGLFSQIASCVPVATATTCTTDTDCSSLNTSTQTSFCNNPTGGTGTGVCEVFPTACNFDLILSTLSAHSYNFIVQVPGGQHTVNAVWKLTGVNTAGSSNVAACTGPGTLTVTQTKVFNNSGSITVQ